MPDTITIPETVTVLTEPLVALLAECLMLELEREGPNHKTIGAVMDSIASDDDPTNPVRIEVFARSVELQAAAIRREAGLLNWLETNARLMRELGTTDVESHPEMQAAEA